MRMSTRARRLRLALAGAVCAALLAVASAQPAPAALPDAPTTWVRVTHYYATGSVMYSGRYPYHGAAACSWNFPEGTLVAFWDGRVVTCEDRGLLGNGECPASYGSPQPVRTAAVASVHVLGEVAIHTKDLEPVGVSFSTQPQIESTAAAVGLQYLSPVGSAIVVDVIDAEEDRFPLTAARAYASIRREDFETQADDVIAFASGRQLWELLSSSPPFRPARVANLETGSGEAPSTGRAFPHSPSPLARSSVNQSMRLSTGTAHNPVRQDRISVAPFTDAIRRVLPPLRLDLSMIGETVLAHLPVWRGRLRASRTSAGFGMSIHAASVPECGWVDIYAASWDEGERIRAAYPTYVCCERVWILRWGW